MSEEYTEQEMEVFEYLNALRESGVTNMYGAGVYIEDEFGIERAEAKALLVKWMATFPARHPQKEESTLEERISDWTADTLERGNDET